MVISSPKILAGGHETLAELAYTLCTRPVSPCATASRIDVSLPVDDQGAAATDVVDGILEDLDGARGLDDWERLACDEQHRQEATDRCRNRTGCPF